LKRNHQVGLNKDYLNIKRILIKYLIKLIKIIRLGKIEIISQSHRKRVLTKHHLVILENLDYFKQKNLMYYQKVKIKIFFQMSTKNLKL